MARKVAEVEITTEGRDKGKRFILTEMPASKAERWAFRAVLAISKSGMHVPDEIVSAGIAGLAQMSVWALANVSWLDAEPLLNEMMACVQIKEPMIVRNLTDDDIEEVQTRLQLRAELFALHTGFFIPGFPSSAVAAKPLIF